MQDMIHKPNMYLRAKMSETKRFLTLGDKPFSVTADKSRLALEYTIKN